MIEIKDLQKKYGNKSALKGISFSVDRGEVFGFLGPNGAGKTTTIKILTGQLLPSYGKVRIMDKDLLKEKNSIQVNTGVVPENANLYERLTVGQNLEFFCRLYNCSTENVDYYLEQVNLLNEKKMQVKKLSKGMKQRVLLIRALLHKPKLLFLDEPTSGLDPSSAESIHKLLKKLNSEGVTMLITSHNMEEVDKLCNRVAFIESGSIVEIGAPGELKLRHSNNKMRVVLENNGINEEKIIDLSGEESAGAMEEWMRSGKVRSVHSCEPTLADIFMKVTGREFV